ncbi:MAG TPA: DUF6089 family protein [Flavobacteriaceae bacterium]|nr:DUF6089 family protein [Flavobacteriaceae bacterium]
MKYFFALLMSMITLGTLTAQTYEIGLTAGGVNFVGDVGSTAFINPTTLGLGGIIRWNRSLRHSFRASLILARLKADDADSHETRRNERGYSFQSTLGEASLGIEYTFWDFDVHSGEHISTPYLYTGLTAIGFHNLYKDQNEVFRADGKSINFAIPMILGYKLSLGRHAILGAEIGARYTFTDNLDGSNPKGDGKENFSFGNTNNNDWYLFTGINLSLTFGRKPCYCNF